MKERSVNGQQKRLTDYLVSKTKISEVLEYEYLSIRVRSEK